MEGLPPQTAAFINLGGVGLLALVLWLQLKMARTDMKTISKRFTKTIEGLVKDFKGELSSERELWRDMLTEDKEDRRTGREEYAAIRDKYHEETIKKLQEVAGNTARCPARADDTKRP